MQFLQITDNMTLKSLQDRVGSRNVDNVLNLNSLSRTPNVGKALNELCESVVAATESVSNQRKISVLNTLTDEADVFEAAALLDDSGWKFLSEKGTMPGMLKMPSTITLPDATDVLGGSVGSVATDVYNKVMDYLKNNQPIDPIAFNEYSTQRGSQTYDTVSVNNAIQWFNIPWGKISLYSSLTGKSLDFPVFPETYQDGYQANFDTMPDMIYQYELWYTYKSSGPRSNTYEFKMHRDMWTGDHRDGKCNELIRFCEANCYPEYNGAAVSISTVTLYISGKPLIRGILTKVGVEYSGPIGLDDFPLVVTLTLDITEISTSPITHSTMQQRGLIG